MDESQLISSKERLKLDLPPSCMQFCPQDPAFFVVGTYNLQKEQGFSGQDSKAIEQPDDEQPVQKKTQNRNGSLIVFALNGDKMLVSISPNPLFKEQCVSKICRDAIKM